MGEDKNDILDIQSPNNIDKILSDMIRFIEKNSNYIKNIQVTLGRIERRLDTLEKQRSPPESHLTDPESFARGSVDGILADNVPFIKNLLVQTIQMEIHYIDREIEILRDNLLSRVSALKAFSRSRESYEDNEKKLIKLLDPLQEPSDEEKKALPKLLKEREETVKEIEAGYDKEKRDVLYELYSTLVTKHERLGYLFAALGNAKEHFRNIDQARDYYYTLLNTCEIFNDYDRIVDQIRNNISRYENLQGTRSTIPAEVAIDTTKVMVERVMYAEIRNDETIKVEQKKGAKQDIDHLRDLLNEVDNNQFISDQEKAMNDTHIELLSNLITKGFLKGILKEVSDRMAIQAMSDRIVTEFRNFGHDFKETLESLRKRIDQSFDTVLLFLRANHQIPIMLESWIDSGNTLCTTLYCPHCKEHEYFRIKSFKPTIKDVIKAIIKISASIFSFGFGIQTIVDFVIKKDTPMKTLIKTAKETYFEINNIIQVSKALNQECTLEANRTAVLKDCVARIESDDFEELKKCILHNEDVKNTMEEHSGCGFFIHRKCALMPCTIRVEDLHSTKMRR
jgi:hypothetical protein